MTDAASLAKALEQTLNESGPWIPAGDRGDGSELVARIEALFAEANGLTELGALLPVLQNALQDGRLLFEDYDYRQRELVADRARHLLEQHLERVLPWLFDWLESPDAAHSRMASDLLKLNAGRALPAVLTRFYVSAETLRYFPILDNVPGPQVVEALLKVYPEAAASVRQQIIKSLGWNFSSLYRSWLNPEAQDESTAFFRERVEPLLRQALTDADLSLYQAALTAINKIGAPAESLHRQVLNAARSADDERLLSTLDYFALVLTAAQLPDYLFLLEHPSPLIRLGAVDTLLQLIEPGSAPSEARSRKARGLSRPDAKTLKHKLIDTLIALLGESAETALKTLQWLEQKQFKPARLSPVLKAIAAQPAHPGAALAETLLKRRVKGTQHP